MSIDNYKTTPEHRRNQKKYRENNLAEQCSATNGWRQSHSGYARTRTNIIKAEVMTHYGNGKCSCVLCGESRLACLSIDHINGGGNRLRKEGREKTGSELYYRLRREDYPKGYRTLCMNCQFCMAVLYGLNTGRPRKGDVEK